MKNLMNLLQVLAFSILFCVVLFKYFAYKIQPDTLTCLILIITAIWISEDNIKDKIDKNNH